MASYKLTKQEIEVVTTWLGEPEGYLEVAVNSVGMSARQALGLSPQLDVADWIRSNLKHADADQNDWDECSMAWWILDNDQVEISVLQRPPESADWIAILQEWDVSILDGFARMSPDQRDQKAFVQGYDLDGVATVTILAGSHLRHQESMVERVIPVLGG